MRAAPDERGDFAARVIAWQRRHGRHDLPWQGTRDPYRVWLSEIMLQQTQVTTVLAYYPRFLQRFADVAALAQASEDEVLALWSGLGYYSRARQLHRCAQRVVADFGGQFPAQAAELATLPGIGRSTAAAIAAFCFGERSAILDGNVKRVLARVWAVDDDLAQAAAVRALWERAEPVLPTTRLRTSMPAYTQGLMDLGATVCLPRQPQCGRCPLASGCRAHLQGNPQRYPVKIRKAAPRPVVALWLLHAVDEQGRVWLQRRPPHGIWAGLHCLPAFDTRAQALHGLAQAGQASVVEHPPFTHILTHRKLHIHVMSGVVKSATALGEAGAWFAVSDWPRLGLPAPVRRFLSQPEVSACPARGGA
ncbi:A/G-specific adenine glycosylase [Ottowia sp.]|uniref:A/G-specific adenine glycosylase n=1 Tax=Ottowia sp. TaxID=1898956 RepID=UPI0025DF2A07|nr:A/G-specific adenine glycosylase [Ottowia sp.]